MDHWRKDFQLLDPRAIRLWFFGAIEPLIYYVCEYLISVFVYVTWAIMKESDISLYKMEHIKENIFMCRRMLNNLTGISSAELGALKSSI
jgi:hypothetical protein